MNTTATIPNTNITLIMRETSAQEASEARDRFEYTWLGNGWYVADDRSWSGLALFQRSVHRCGRTEWWQGSCVYREHQEELDRILKHDPRNGCLAAPTDRELLESWEYYDEDEREWAIRNPITGKFYVGIEGPEVIFGLDGFWKGRKEIAEEICDLLEGEAGIELLEVVKIKGV